MPNLDPWLNQNNNYEDMTTKTINIFENHLLSIKTERQNMIHRNFYPTYNERHQKIWRNIKQQYQYQKEEPRD